MHRSILPVQDMDFQKRSELTNGMDRSSVEPGQQQSTFNIDNFFDAFLQLDFEGAIKAWNLQAEEMFGWSRSEALERPAGQLIVPARNRRLFQEALEFVQNGNSGQRSRTQMTALHRDGAEFEVEAIFFSMRSGAQSDVGLFARQLGQRKLTEVEAQKYHRDLMDQLAECYAEMDLRGNITFVNKAYSETFGISREYREGHNYKTIFAPQITQLFRDVYGKVYTTGKAAKVDYSLILQNGKEVFNEQSVSLKRDSQGNVAGFMVIVRDCLERKQNEIELVRAKQAAETASKAKGEFLANMSHEIRTPLNGVIGMFELMGYTNPTAEQQELLDIAEGAANSLLAAINDVLDFSKIEVGKLQLDRAAFDLVDTVAEAVSITRVNAVKKGLEMTYDLANDVPRIVLGDSIRLKQVLLNLIGNAVKFTPRGGIQVRVHTESVREGKVELRFSVADSGIGIPANKQRVIFEAFSQADASTTREFGGTGLGLAICSRIVQLMGGRIWVESESGKGSTFYFTAVLEIAGDAGQEPEEPLIDPSPGQSQPLRILLAEDNLINQKLAVRLLERLGHQVVVAADGIEVLSRLQDQLFDLVLMDVQMPEMDGFAATAEIRAREQGTNQRLPIIAMTAHALQGDRERCLEAGMDDYICKPVSANAIQQGIARIVKPRARS